MWANAQRNGRPAEYRWRPLFNAGNFGWRPLLVPCSNAGKKRTALKLAGVPQTRQQITAVSGTKFTISWGHVEDILLFNKFFFDCQYVSYSCKDMARQSCAMVPRWQIFGDFLRPAFPVSHVPHVSDLHPKFALRPHHVWKYGRHPICNGWD